MVHRGCHGGEPFCWTARNAAARAAADRDAFAAYLANFETVYHTNGQQTLDIRGDRAIRISYCLVVLFGTENGTKIKYTAGVTYNDEYVRCGNTWLIENTFTASERVAIGPTLLRPWQRTHRGDPRVHPRVPSAFENAHMT